MSCRPPALRLQGDSPPVGTVPALLALDLGTTTLVGRLLTADRTVLAEARAANPQRTLGADILTRLQRAREGGGEELRRLLIAGIGDVVADLLTTSGRSAGAIGAVAAAGNPGICHLLLGLPVERLLFPPHRTPLTEPASLPLDACFREGDSPRPAAVASTLFPAVTGFVGGDLVAVLYGFSGSRLLAREGGRPHAETVPALVLDLGTNAELALWTGEHWLATSAAAGPAFEAGNVACGMPLAPGAVTDVDLSGDRLVLTVHGGGRPLGLCGSGLLALVAAARRGGLIDAGGRIVAPDEVGTNLSRYLAATGDGWKIVFHRDARGELRLTQQDVRQLQLAKGAVRAGVEVLLDRAGLAEGDVETVLITGAFGSALPVAPLKGIAMLPEGMVDKSFSVANGVLDGLAAFLADPNGFERLQSLLATIKPLPLSGTPAFEKRFLAALEFEVNCKS